MNTTFKRCVGLMMALAITSILGLVRAQSPEQMLQMPLPTDPAVRIGQLENGMTYYIRANAYPKDRAEFYILHHVGAILENDQQNGLAHFTEHMAFNGTKHFPGKKLLNFLEHNGVKFGADVNAFTTQDITCYNISDVPTHRPGLLDSCTQVLCDWSGDISFDHSEIDDERGVIIEEWRARRNADWRAMEAKHKVLFRGSKYAERDVIGSLDLLKTFKYQTIKDFYHKWYRPEFQAIIVVGDFDADQMEARIKRMAGALPRAKDTTPKPVFEIPQAQGVEYASYTDPEIQMSRLELIYKLPPKSKQPKDLAYFRNNLQRSLISLMLNARFQEVAQHPDAPFLVGVTAHVNMVEPMDNTLVIGVGKPGQIKTTLRGLIEESQRARQKGFTQGELDRAKLNLTTSLEAQFNERAKISNSSYVQEYISHFVGGEPIPGIELELKLSTLLLQSIDLASVNAILQEMMPGKDLMIFIQAPEAEAANLPSQKEVQALFDEIYASDLEAWVDNVRNEPLIAEPPTPGTIVAERQNGAFGTTEWTLSNGIRVILKPTDFKDNEIILRGRAMGGRTLLPTELLLSSEVATSVREFSGLAGFSPSDLQKLSAGRQASTSVDMSQQLVSVSGQSTTKPEDIEYMFQELYLTLTQPRFEQDAFNTVMGHIRTVLQNQAQDPQQQFVRRLQGAMNQNSPRRPQLTLDNIEEISLQKAEKAYRQLFANTGNFIITIVGNFSPEELKPHILTYLATLPQGKKTFRKDDGVRMPSKDLTDNFKMKMETPKTFIGVVFSSPATYDAQDLVYIEALDHVFDLRATEEIREKAGAAYSVLLQSDLRQFPVEQAVELVIFPTDPEKSTLAVSLVDQIFKGMKNEISADDVEKAQKHFEKSYEENVRKNAYWAKIILEKEITGVDCHTDYLQTVKSITPKSLSKAARRIFKQPVRIQVVMSPEN